MNRADTKRYLLADNSRLKDKLELVNSEINTMSTKFTNLSEEKEKLLNISNGEYETIIDFIEKELIRSKTLLSFKYATKKNLKRQILENKNNLITYDKLFRYLRETLNIYSSNIQDLTITNIKEFTILDKELIKEYIEFYNITTDFNINYYLTEVDLYTKIDKDIIRKAVRNWMDFKNLSNIPIKPKYILSVISSSAGIEGWAKCYNSSA